MTASKHKLLMFSHWMCISSFLLWCLVFSLQSHKEERFMYPIYPLICASGAHTIKLIEQFVTGAKQPYSSPVFKTIVAACCLLFLGLSLSRVLSIRLGKYLDSSRYFIEPSNKSLDTNVSFETPLLHFRSQAIEPHSMFSLT